LKVSPDSSGYAARSVSTCRGAAAFERIAGSPFVNHIFVSLLKKSNYLALILVIDAKFLLLI